MISWLKYGWQRVNWLSLDVVAGALVSHRMAAQLPDRQGTTHWATSLILACVVLGTYFIDRLIDNWHREPSTARHRFQNRYALVIIKVLGGLAFVILVALFWLPAPVWKVGASLGVLTTAYLLGVWKLPNSGFFEASKDILVPLFYTIGVWGTALAMQPKLTWEMMALGAAFYLIVQQNLLLNAYFESFTLEAGHSLAIQWGEQATRQVLIILYVFILLLSLAVAVFTLPHYGVRVAWVLIVMGSLQHYLWHRPADWLPNERYRYVADGVFLLPLLVV
jgi:hypothetical protein